MGEEAQARAGPDPQPPTVGDFLRSWQGVDNSFTFTAHPAGETTAERRQDGTGEASVSAPDRRNKLATEGKFVTQGILFDVNCDKIRGESLQTDGPGESQPVDKNDNPAGKANNRRVEFVKI